MFSEENGENLISLYYDNEDRLIPNYEKVGIQMFISGYMK
jgi:hypothetical protein